jgi:phosphoglycolate phosphatase
MQFKCVIFDLDGTLVDTIADIALSMNRALESHGYPPAALEDYRAMVGWGIRRLAFLALPPRDQNEETAAIVAAGAARFYAERPLLHSKIYPGIAETVAALRSLKIKTAVLTNKPDPVAHLVINGLFPQGSFDIIQGDRPDLPRKPDPASTWEILTELDVPPRNAIFMGDSEIDMETALAADCHALGVSWGFRDRRVLEKAGAQRIIDRPEELLALIRDKAMKGERLTWK